MFQVINSVIFFLVAILILVTFHEYGHFIVARMVGVKVKRFSVGFGKVLFSWYDKKQTQFAISAIPLGGYVKMVDEREESVAEEDLPYAFNRKPVLSRMAVIIAGPLFNVIFAVAAYWVMFVVGIDAVAPVVGQVSIDSIAAEAGLQSGDELVSVDQQHVTGWRDVYMELISHVGDDKTVTLDIKRQGQRQSLIIDTANWSFDASDPDVDLLDSLGIKPYFPEGEIAVKKVLPDTPAEKLALQPGDVIEQINGVVITSWQQLLDLLSDKANKKVDFVIKRGNETLNLSTVLDGKEDKDSKQRGFLGIAPDLPDWPEDMVRVQRYGPINAVGMALQKTWDVASLSWQLLVKMVSGKLSVKGVSGPIGIAQGAGYSASLGLSYFLNFLALISISLALINILPIPILDGGHFMYCLYELVTGKAVSERFQYTAAQVGLFLLVGLMFLAFYNDLTRL